MTIHAGRKHDMNWLLQFLKFKLKGVFFKHLMDQYPHFICYCIYKQYKKSEDLKSPHFQLITLSQSLNFAFFQLTGAPATSPGSTGSGSNLSPSCGESSAASAHNPAPSPLSSHRSLPGNVPEAMGGQQVTEKLNLSQLHLLNRLEMRKVFRANSSWTARWPPSPPPTRVSKCPHP